MKIGDKVCVKIESMAPYAGAEGIICRIWDGTTPRLVDETYRYSVAFSNDTYSWSQCYAEDELTVLGD